MYGDYIVLDNYYNHREERNIAIGDIFIFLTNTDGIGTTMLIYDRYNQDFDNLMCNISKENEQKYKDFLSYKEDLSKSTNIFHEYSKFLRKEENKWEDVRKVLNIEL